jgi:uncharacterized coiled-coil protein SlyX
MMITLAAPVFSQTASDNSSKDSSKKDDVSTLKQQVAEQQKEIEQLRSMVNQMKQKLDQPPSAATAKVAPATAAPAPTAPAPAQTAVVSTPNLGEVASTSPMVPKAKENASAESSGGVVGPTLTPSAAIHSAGQEAANESDQESPLTFHIGSATLTPVGFMDFTGVVHSHVAGGNIGTSFGSIPYATSTGGVLPYQTNLSEVRLSIQNSRIGFRTDADVKGAHVIGYMEADFLGTPASTNVAVTSNSQLLRARLYWVDVMKGGWEVLGGQTWSLLTPGRAGISPLPSDVFYTQDMDVNYQLGLFWGRIPELRVAYHHPSGKAAFAVAIDSPDQYAGGSSGGSSIVLPTGLATPYAGELDFGASSGGIATPNLAPDVIAKLALDPSKRVHFEIGGVERSFKVYYPGVAAVAATAATATTPATPAVTAIPSATFSTEGGGGFANLHVEIFKGFRLMTNNFWSDGGGRYIFGQAPDLVANVNGSISPLHSSSTVSGFEFTHKNTLIFSYYGGLMISRDPVLDTTGKLVGYGYKGSSSSQNRTIQEATFGFNQAIYKHPKYGALNLIGQYSYLTRDPWYVATGQPANATMNMVFIDLRYTLPGSAPTLGKPAR